MIPRRAVLDQEMSHAEFRALAAVASFRNTVSGWAWPSQAAIADALGLKKGQAGEERVRQLLKGSVQRGYLELVPGTGRFPSRYRVIFDHPCLVDQVAPEATDPLPLEIPLPSISKGSAPLVSKGSAPLVSKGCTIRRNYKNEQDTPPSLRSGTDTRREADDLFSSEVINPIPNQPESSPSKASPPSAGNDEKSPPQPEAAPQANKGGGPSAAAKRGTRGLTPIPADFWPDQAGQDFAASRGIVNIPVEVQKFIDNHDINSRKSANHSASWRTWCLKHQQWADERRAAGARSSPAFRPNASEQQTANLRANMQTMARRTGWQQPQDSPAPAEERFTGTTLEGKVV